MNQKISPDCKYTLLTGATGLVGRYLVKTLLVEGVRLAVLVRNSKKHTAAERVEQICRFWEKQLGVKLSRPVVLTGDVCQENLGLSRSDLDWVKESCDTCFHNAALLSFNNAPRTEEPWLTNLDGTQNVLDLCKSADIQHMHYVSTAYVCGSREGTILESELECGQEFRNHYEESKFCAEKLVREFDHFRTTTIYRPAVITADSETGYTTTYHGLHLYLRLMSMLVPQVEPDENGIRHTNIRLPMRSNEPRNVVTVDWVADVMTELFLNKSAHGKTFHISPNVKLTPRSVIDACYKYFNSTGVKYMGSEDEESENQSEDETTGRFEFDFLSNVGIYMLYDCCDPNFATDNLSQFASHVICPTIDEATIHRFMDFGNEDCWGKRRERLTPASFVVEKNLDHLEEQAIILRETLGKNTSEFVIGFDVIGEGGSQWHYDSTTGMINRGLPMNPDDPIVRITADTLGGILTTAPTGIPNWNATSVLTPFVTVNTN